jgi:hypothetical protein
MIAAGAVDDLFLQSSPDQHDERLDDQTANYIIRQMQRGRDVQRS